MEDNSEDPEKAQLVQKLQASEQQMQQMQQAVMQEIEKIKNETEVTRAKHEAEKAQLRVDRETAALRARNEAEKLANERTKLSYEERRLRMEEDRYANAPNEASPEEQWDYDRQKLEEQWDYDRQKLEAERAFQSEQKRLDRQTELAKSIIAKTDIGSSPEMEDQATAEALSHAAHMIQQPALAQATRGSSSNEKLDLIFRALTEPKRIVTNEHGDPVGAEIVMDGDGFNPHS